MYVEERGTGRSGLLFYFSTFPLKFSKNFMVASLFYLTLRLEINARASNF